MASHDEALTTLSSLLERSLDLDPSTTLQPATLLEDLGIDSVDLAFIFAYWERTAGAVFDDDEFDVGRYETIGDLAAALAAKAEGSAPKPAEAAGPPAALDSA